MAQNILQLGEIVDIVVPTGGCTGGKGLLVDTVVAIPLSTAAEGAIAQVVFEALAHVDKATGTAWTLGAVIYWDDSAKNFTTESTSNTRAGVAAAAAASDATTGLITLFQLPAADAAPGGSVTISGPYASNAAALLDGKVAGDLYQSTTLINGSPIILQIV